jgi:integrase
MNLPLTFHIARHTFATIYLELGGTTEVLMKQMGISKYETIRVYVHVAEKRQKEQMHNMNKLIDPALFVLRHPKPAYGYQSPR